MFTQNVKIVCMLLLPKMFGGYRILIISKFFSSPIFILNFLLPSDVPQVGFLLLSVI